MLLLFLMVKVGLEIHGYINTQEKLFCNCKSLHGSKIAKPNTNICVVCTSQPGSKPLLPNESAVDKSVEIALILNCKINEKLIWQRKHYDWPDLPKGFQSTLSGAHAMPIGINGEFLGIRIREAHLEEDPAAWNPKTGEIDYNRSGCPLIEIVTEPDFTSSEQVVDWLKQLIVTLGYIKALDKSAGIKADVNISLPELNGERVEVKNVNSIKNIKTTIESEIIRQKQDVPKVQETRMFDEAKGITIKMRSKEQAQDYRFISEPDLPTLIIEKKKIDLLKNKLPETPQQKLQKLIQKNKIEKKYAEVLIKKIEIAEFFEKVIEKIDVKLACPWVTIELLNVLNYNKKELEDVEIKPEHFIELLSLIQNKKITELKAKDILRSWKEKSLSPLKEAQSNATISSETELKQACKGIIAENPNPVNDYKSGKQEALNFLIGKVMQKTNKRADFKTTREVLESLLK